MSDHVTLVQSSFLPKPSRTLIFPDASDDVQDLLSKHDVPKRINATEKEKKTIFVECENLKDSIELYTKVFKNNMICRYANYRMFLRITSDTSLYTYDEFKTFIKNKLHEVIQDVNIMYFKLYQKDNRLTGNGYIVIDKYEDLKLLIKKNFLCEENNVSFQLLNFIKKAPVI